MQDFSASPREMFASFWRNRSLIFALSKREILGRYRGSILGLLWLLLNPLFMLTIYTFIFSEVFKVRWGSSASESKTEFALVLFAGLIVFSLFTECINRAPSLILANPNYVKKVVFPLEILPFVSMVNALFHTAISLGVWFVAYILFFGMPYATVLLLPLVLLPLTLFVMGLSWALASLGVFLRDISQFIGVITTLLMFLSPIFYEVTSFPVEFRQWLYLNPLTLIIEQTRDVLYWGKEPEFFLLGLYCLASFVVAWIGFAWFQKTRKGFADVL